MWSRAWPKRASPRKPALPAGRPTTWRSRSAPRAAPAFTSSPRTSAGSRPKHASLPCERRRRRPSRAGRSPPAPRRGACRRAEDAAREAEDAARATPSATSFACARIGPAAHPAERKLRAPRRSSPAGLGVRADRDRSPARRARESIAVLKRKAETDIAARRAELEAGIEHRARELDARAAERQDGFDGELAQLHAQAKRGVEAATEARAEAEAKLAEAEAKLEEDGVAD